MSFCSGLLVCEFVDEMDVEAKVVRSQQGLIQGYAQNNAVKKCCAFFGFRAQLRFDKKTTEKTQCVCACVSVLLLLSLLFIRSKHQWQPGTNVGSSEESPHQHPPRDGNSFVVFCLAGPKRCNKNNH